MTVASVLRNRIPKILKEKGLTISDLMRQTGMAYPTVHNVARDSAEIIPDNTYIGTLRQISEALDLPIGDLVEVVKISEKK
ncbi:MAG: helix-turn-helix domain-containing protein [Anaerolineae bacterium]|nr:helix-turn-helix domain-containing protein [Anaerolineae bacterium]